MKNRITVGNTLLSQGPSPVEQLAAMQNRVAKAVAEEAEAENYWNSGLSCELLAAAEALVSKARTIQEQEGQPFKANNAAFLAALNHMEALIVEYRHNSPSLTDSIPTSETGTTPSPSSEREW